MPADPPLLMAVDGNSLLHRAHHAHADSRQRDLAGRPVWALRGMVAAVGGAAGRLTPDAVLIAFDCGGDLDRSRSYPAYKAGRPPKPLELVEQLADAPGLLRAAGFSVVQTEGCEADDVLASAAASARAAGWRCTVVTSDRDSFALIDDTTSVLRVISGGIDASALLTPARLPLLCGVRAGQYRDYAAVRGDASDNLPGAHGVGAKTAAKLLGVFDGVADVFAALDSGREAEVEAAVGAAAARRLATPQARANVTRNLDLMRMREDLPVPHPDAMRVPLDLLQVQRALRDRDIHLGPSLWALTGGAAPGTGQWAWLAEQDEVAPASEDDGLRELVSQGLVAAAPAPPAPRGRRAKLVPDASQLSLF